MSLLILPLLEDYLLLLSMISLRLLITVDPSLVGIILLTLTPLPRLLSHLLAQGRKGRKRNNNGYVLMMQELVQPQVHLSVDPQPISSSISSRQLERAKIAVPLWKDPTILLCVTIRSFLIGYLSIYYGVYTCT
jgi:hypothetical protein